MASITNSKYTAQEIENILTKIDNASLTNMKHVYGQLPERVIINTEMKAQDSYTVNIGFKPQILIIYGINVPYVIFYDENIDKKYYFSYDRSWQNLNEYGIPSSSGEQIKLELNDNGFYFETDDCNYTFNYMAMG